MIHIDDDAAWEELTAAYLVTNRCSKEWGLEWLRRSRWGVAYHDELEMWDRVRGRALIDTFRALSIASLESQFPDGDIAEFGIAAGGSVAFLGLLASSRARVRAIDAVDSFEGLPAPDRAFDSAYREGQFAIGEQDVRDWIAALGLADRIRIHASRFEEVAPAMRSSYGLVHLDGDLFHSTCAIATIMEGLLTPSAALVCDDAWDESGGVRAAVRATWMSRRRLSLGPTGQLICFSNTAGDGTVSAEWAHSLAGYIPFLIECSERESGDDRRAVLSLLRRLR